MRFALSVIHTHHVHRGRGSEFHSLQIWLLFYSQN